MADMDSQMVVNSLGMDDSCDSCSDIGNRDYTDANNYDSQIESGSESQVDFVEMGMRNSTSAGLTMKEYEEQLKKLTAENFNLKLRVYFVEERLSKVTGISDKEDLIKKNIQLKVTCESQLKELEKKQELLFEASKAFELLQKEHAEEVERLTKEKDKEITELEEKFLRLESEHGQLKSKFPNAKNLNDPNAGLKSFQDYERQINELELNLRDEEDRYRDLENVLKDNQLELESFRLKSQRVENELDQRMRRIEELVDELEQKEHDLASANFRIRKLEDELQSKEREDEIMKERVEEKNKTIESLKNSLASRDETIEILENRVAKERSSSQTLQSKIDSLSFQNARLKEELEILQSRLRRTTESLSPRSKLRPSEDDIYKQKYDEAMRELEEQQTQHSKRLKELEEKLYEKDTEAEDYHELFEKHKKLEDDHRKACTALKNFIKRSSEEKKEREALNHLLNNHEEVIADLKAQLDQYRSYSSTRVPQDDKLSLAGTGDNNRILGRETAHIDNDNADCCYENSSGVKGLSLLPEEGVLENKKIEENIEKMTELEAEVIVLGQEIYAVDSGVKSVSKQLLVSELETKKCEIEKLNGELKKRNINLQEIVNKELWDKNRQIEKLEKRLTEAGEVNRLEVEALREKVTDQERQLEALESKLQECGVSTEVEIREQSNQPKVRKEAVEVCSILAARLEELAVFLDSLLSDCGLLNGIGSNKRQDIKLAVEKSLELSRNLSLSLADKNLNDSFCIWNEKDNCRGDGSFPYDSFGVLTSRDKVISEQSIIINKLREQLKVLNQEIKQRDIELSRYQENSNHECRFSFSDVGIEGQTLSVCADISDEEEEPEDESGNEVNDKSLASEKVSKGKTSEEKKCWMFRSQETSESEAWSEPDRSVSLARMGNLEDAGVNVSHRNSRCEDSSESSQETLNENCKSLGKRCRSTESEIRRLQSRVKTLDELNENLRLEITSLKNGKIEMGSSSRIQKNEEANLIEKLRKTMDRLDECSLTCRHLEEKLAGALERASSSAMQLSRATETISELEEEISRLKEELKEKNFEIKEKDQRIIEIEKKLEELTIESELKIIEAVKEKEAAERKTQEVECRLKDAENMSKEVESRVNEIEKKINETKKFKKETVLHFKEAEKHVDTAEKMMEEAEKIKLEAERKSKDFQSFIDLMRKEVEEKIKEAERRVKKTDKEKEDLEKQVVKLKKRLLEAERNKAEVEVKVKEGKETIRCMEEKLKELEVAMNECSEEAQRKIKEVQQKAEAKVAALELKIEERDWVRKTEVEKKMSEAEKISRELEIGFRKQLEDAEKMVKKAKENAEVAIKNVQEEAKKQGVELLERIAQIEAEKEKECSGLRRQLDEAKLEASEFELELTKLTNEKIHLEEELKKMLDKESALVKDNREIRGKYETSIHELEDKLTRLALNKSQLASRLDEIESTNIDLVSRISAIRKKESTTVEEEAGVPDEENGFLSPPYSPPSRGSFPSDDYGVIDLFLPPPDLNGNKRFMRQGSVASDPGDQLFAARIGEVFVPPRRNMNSSPDLGIESDPGRFSSLEANPQMHGDQVGVSGNEESSMKKLENENAELRRRLVRTRQALEETLTQLSAANQRKKQVERAICKQLHKTHHILKKARVNFESQDGEALE